MGEHKRGRAPRDEGDGPRRRLAGLGGIGLVMFFLARRKMEFALTPEGSPLGDIWVATGMSKYGIEVKTSRNKLEWQIKASQIARVDFYVLVSMDRGQCFVLTAAEMMEATTNAPKLYGDVRKVSYANIPDKSLNAWHKIDRATVAEPLPPPKPSAPRRPKVVRKTLVDGTVKTYSYDRDGIGTICLRLSNERFIRLRLSNERMPKVIQ